MYEFRTFRYSSSRGLSEELTSKYKSTLKESLLTIAKFFSAKGFKVKDMEVDR